MPFATLIRFAAAIGLTLLLHPCSAQTSRPEYGIREDEPRTGSSIRHYVSRGSPIPINRRYHELTAEEKASLNAYYEKMEPGDEPPFPLEGLKPIHTSIKKGQAALRVWGDLILVVTIDANGEAQTVKAIGSPSPEMTKYAAAVLLMTKYKPALCQGQPCRMDLPLSFRFQLE